MAAPAAALATPKGLHRLTFEDYVALPAVNWTTLKEMRRSPLHYAHRLANPKEDTTRLALGRACHTAVFEPDRFLLDYALFEGEARRGKEWTAFKELHADKTILKRDEYELCIEIRDAVREHPVASKYLAKGRAEQTITWTDEETGLLCKARLDFVSEVPGLAALLDMKTTQTVDAALFGATAARMGWHDQAAWYVRGLAANGLPLMPAKLLAVELEPPHDVAVFDVDPDALYAGEEECRELLAKVAECRAANAWPGRYANELPLKLPAWFYAQADEEQGGPLGLDIGGEEI